MRYLFLAITLAIGILTDLVLRHWLSGYPRFSAALLLITAYTALLVICDNPFVIAKGLLFAATAILISFFDGLTHEIPNLLLLPVIAVGMIDFDPVTAFAGFLVTILPFLLISVLTKGGIGGGDIKLMAVTGFSLGPLPAVCGALLGLLAFMPFSAVCRYHKHKSSSYALAPWLCSGCFLAYLLNH